MLALVASAVVSGCAATDAPTTAAEAPNATAARPDAVESGAAVPGPSGAAPSGGGPVGTPGDCGVFDLGQGEPLPAAAGRCLAEAVRAEQPARLQFTELTVEGAPIVTTYTAWAGGRVEVVTDSRQDGFGPKAVTSRSCTGVSFADGRLRVSGCSTPVPLADATMRPSR